MNRSYEFRSTNVVYKENNRINYVDEKSFKTSRITFDNDYQRVNLKKLIKQDKMNSWIIINNRKFYPASCFKNNLHSCGYKIEADIKKSYDPIFEIKHHEHVYTMASLLPAFEKEFQSKYELQKDCRLDNSFDLSKDCKLDIYDRCSLYYYLNYNLWKFYASYLEIDDGIKDLDPFEIIREYIETDQRFVEDNKKKEFQRMICRIESDNYSLYITQYKYENTAKITSKIYNRDNKSGFKDFYDASYNYNILLYDSRTDICLIDMRLKYIWKTYINGAIVNKINHKISFLESIYTQNHKLFKGAFYKEFDVCDQAENNIKQLIKNFNYSKAFLDESNTNHTNSFNDYVKQDHFKLFYSELV